MRLNRPNPFVNRTLILFFLAICFATTNPNTSYAQQQGSVYAVLIGISKYKRFQNRQKRWQDLEYTVNDVRGLLRVLTGPGKVPTQNIKVLTDHNARKRNIVLTLSRWLRKARPQDTVMIYFSGHGAAGSDGISYWMAHDTPRTSISQFLIDGLLSRLRTKRVVLLIDACQSGQGIKGTRGGTGRKGIISPSLYRASGRITIASSKQNEFSYESKKLKHGIFSYALMQALQGKADVDGDGVVDADEAYRYLVRHVPKLAWKLKRGQQHPVRHTLSTGLFALSFPGVKQRKRKQKAPSDQPKKKTTAPTNHLFAKAEKRRLRLLRLRFTGNSRKDKRTLRTIIKEGKVLAKMYGRVAKSTTSAYWIYASVFRRAEIYHLFVDKLLAAPAPKHLNPSVRVRYRAAMENFAARFSEPAIDSYKDVLKSVKKHKEYNRWSCMAEMGFWKLSKKQSCLGSHGRQIQTAKTCGMLEQLCRKQANKTWCKTRERILKRHCQP